MPVNFGHNAFKSYIKEGHHTGIKLPMQITKGKKMFYLFCVVSHVTFLSLRVGIKEKKIV